MKKATARQKKMASIRRLKKLFTSKKATSPGIVALLLVLITVVAGFFFYNVVAGSIGSMTSNVQEQMEILFLRSVSINATHITSFIGNSGIWAVNIVSAYINDQIGNLFQSVEIEKGSVEPVYILGTFTKGLTYTVKLMSNFGSSLKFEVTYM
ncbi:MAG: hypothetical protein ACE5J6_02580, partial [Candidatus Bathyarchaeia archaeon]